MRVALYARCSTADQSVDLQLDGLRDYAKVRGFEVVEEYLDEAQSGATARRPGLDQLLDDAHRRRFDAVVVWKLDRLGRSLHHLLTVAGEFEALGVDLIVLDDGIDTTTPAGKLFFQIRGAFAEYERALIRERTIAGVAAAKRRGKRLGRPRVHVPLSRAQTLLAEGLSMAAVARELGIARSSLHRALSKNVSDGATVTA
ncbi:MAG: recombinase family protein [Gemmatimonadota bacterium]